MSDLISRFYDAQISAELFTLPNGVNEFDITVVDGVYHLAYDDQTTTQLVSAPSLALLATAVPASPWVAGRYPSMIHDGGVWHVWVWEGSRCNHYTATDYAGPYTFSDALPLALTDIHVRRLSNGYYYAVYKDQNSQPRRVGTLVSRSSAGPWTNMGLAFGGDAQSLFEGEAADPALFEADGEVYLVFSGWDGAATVSQQRVLIASFDPQTARATSNPTVIVSPLAEWQRRGGMLKVFNGVFLREEGEPDRLFYAQNITARGTAAGWGYIEARAPTLRRAGDLVHMNFTKGLRDPASGVDATLWGTALVAEDGLSVGPDLGGAFGPASFSTLDDFSLLVDFTPTELPANGGAAQIAYVAGRSRTPLLGLWQFPDGRIYWEVRQQGGVGSIAVFWPLPRPAGVRTRIVVTRQGGRLTGYVDGHPEVLATLNGPMTGVQEWGVGNPKGVDSPSNAHQLYGIVHRLMVHRGALEVADI